MGYHPLVYNHHYPSIPSIMGLRRKQIQPRSGPEKAFGQVVREIRDSRGLSQMDLYMESGLDRTFISAIERGIQSPTLKTIVRLSRALDVKPSEMMRRMEKSRFYHL